MKYSTVVIAVKDIHESRKFYEDLFGLELYQDYGICIAFKGGLSLQQDFDWLVGIPKEKIAKEANNMELCFEETEFDAFLAKLKGYAVRYVGDVFQHTWGQRVVRFYDPNGHLIEVGEDMKMVISRFISQGMSMEQISQKMDASIEDLEKLLQAR